MSFANFAADLVQYAKNLFEAFKSYGLALKSLVMEQLPGLLDSAKQLP
jgi:hypothetical protein